MSKAVGIKAGDFIECEGCMYSDFVVGHSYEVHEDDNGLYMLGGLGDKLRLSEVYTFTKELSGNVYAMCLGASFIKRNNKNLGENKVKDNHKTVKEAKDSLPTYEFRADRFFMENKLTGESISFPTAQESFVYKVERWLGAIGKGCDSKVVSDIVIKNDKEALLKIQKFILDLGVSSDEEFKVIVDCKWRRNDWEEKILGSSLEDLVAGKVRRNDDENCNFWVVRKVKLI